MKSLLAALIALGSVDTPFRTGESMNAWVTDSVTHFPRVEGSNLEGRRFVLPADFEGEYNIVFVAFRREQQADVDGWLPFVRQLAASRPALRTYELPTLKRTYRLMSRYIDGGMARGIPERSVREATITLYIDKSPFKQALAIDTEDDIATLLVDRAGRVHWRAKGIFTDVRGRDLAAAVDSLTRVVPRVASSAVAR